jgi:hypothetical protein
MAEPDWNPDTAGRPLAEILREAGIESAARSARRRRWDDPDETGLRQRRAEAAADARPGFGRRAGDLADTGGARRVAPEPSTAAIPGLRPSRTPDVPGAAAATSAAPQRERRSPDDDRRDSGTGRRDSDSDTGRLGTDTGRRDSDTGRLGTDTGRRGPETGRRRAVAAEARAAKKAAAAARSEGRGERKADAEDFSTGPIPIVRAGDEVLTEEEATPRESAMAWLRFAGELVIALAAGVGVYFLATVLWEQLPQLAVLLTPLAVTGLVAGVGMWRQRMGRDAVGLRLLAVLVFAGALLTVAPAAGLLAG